MKRVLKWTLGILGVIVLAFFVLVAVSLKVAGTATPEPAAISSTTEDVVATPVVAAEMVVQIEATDRPTSLPNSSATPRPTNTIRPTNTPRPTSTPKPLPTNTVRPTKTPQSTATPVPPTATALPTRTPLPPTATIAPTAAIVGELAQVTHIVDGDTIDVSINGTTYRVRYIGMDTPERGAPCAREATTANADLVWGQTVRLVRDVSETDRYDRLLRYVYVGDTFVNGVLVSGGWAIAKDYPPDTAMSAVLHSLEAQGVSRGCALVAAPTATVVARAPQPVPIVVPPPAAQPTAAPVIQPTAPLATGSGALVIIGVDKRAEYVDIKNNGGEINLAGWVLRSEKGSQDCSLGGTIATGQVLRIWAMASDAGQGGFNCRFGSNIWNNSEPDAALLIDPSGTVISRW